MTRDELAERLDSLQRDLWEALRRSGAEHRIPEHAVEEFAIYAVLGIVPTYQT